MKPFPLILFTGNAGVGKDTAAQLIQEVYGKDKVFVTASAVALKKLAKEIFDFTDEQLFGPSENRNQVDKRFTPGTELHKKFFHIDEFGTCHLDDMLSAWAQEHISPEPELEKLAQVTAGVAEFLYKQSYLDFGLSPRVVLQILGTEFGRALDQSIWIKQSIQACLDAVEKGAIFAIITDGRFLNEVFAAKRAGGVVIRIQGDSTLSGSQHASELEMNNIPWTLIDHTVYNPKVSKLDFCGKLTSILMDEFIIYQSE